MNAPLRDLKGRHVPPSKVRLLIWALLVLIFGLIVGYMRGGEVREEPPAAQSDLLQIPPERSQQTHADSDPVSEERLERQVAENLKLEQRKRDLELGLAAARSVQGVEEAPVVVPPTETQAAQAELGPSDILPFPANLSEPYTPDGFQNVARRAVRECGMPLTVVAIDCSEFPCIAWTRVTGPNETGEPFSMDSCGPWAEVFKRTMVVGSVSRADVEPREVYFAWMALPEQEDLVQPATARARERIAHMKTAMELQ